MPPLQSFSECRRWCLRSSARQTAEAVVAQHTEATENYKEKGWFAFSKQQPAKNCTVLEVQTLRYIKMPHVTFKRN